MDDLRELEIKMQVKFEEWAARIGDENIYTFSVFGTEVPERFLLLVYNNKTYMCKDANKLVDFIAQELEDKYRLVDGGRVQSLYASDYNFEIEKNYCKLSIYSKYVDILESLMKKLEETMSDKYDTHPKLGVLSEVQINGDKYSIDEVNLVRAINFRQETEKHKYEYEYTLIREDGDIRKMREEKLLEMIKYD